MKLHEQFNPGAPVSLRLGAQELWVFSVSGLATYVHAPGLDAVFDLGHCTWEAARAGHVLLSHTHQDHVGGLWRHLALRQLTGLGRPRVFVPRGSRDALAEHLQSWLRLEQHPADALDVDAVLHPVGPGDSFPLGRRGSVEVFSVHHRIESVGFTVTQRRRRLLPQWVGAPGPELGAARARGERIDEEFSTQALTYVGDSTLQTLREAKGLGASEVLVLEATHLGDTDRATAARWGHTHLEELAELWREQPEALASPHIVLKHFSMRYSRAQILDAVRALPPGLRERVVAAV